MPVQFLACLFVTASFGSVDFSEKSPSVASSVWDFYSLVDDIGLASPKRLAGR